MESKLDNFKGKKHSFTKEDCVKGGKRKTDAKILRSRINPIKSGKHVSITKYCDECLVWQFCSEFREGHKRCLNYSPKAIQKVMFAKNLATMDDFDTFMFSLSQDIYKAKEHGSYYALSKVFERILELYEIVHS